MHFTENTDLLYVLAYCFITFTDCSIRVYYVIYTLISKDIAWHNNSSMPALCSMLSCTYYAQDYAGIIGGSLTMNYPCTGISTQSMLGFDISYYKCNLQIRKSLAHGNTDALSWQICQLDALEIMLLMEHLASEG